MLISCSSPESVAQKALKVVGLGTFAPTEVDRYIGRTQGFEAITMFSDYDKVFSRDLIRSSEAEDFRRSGYYREIDQEEYFYFSNAIFEKWELVKKDQYEINLYGLSNAAAYEGLTPEAIERIEKAHEHIHKDYVKNGNISTWLVAEDVPAFDLRYKLDNRFFANITVIKIPDEGYRVCSFRIDK